MALVPPKPGERRGGRKAGVPNKTTTAVKEAILAAYEGIGGNERLQQWAKDNPDDFYTKVWIKVLPQEVNANVTGDIRAMIIGEAQ